jgi:hypothetical protein
MAAAMRSDKVVAILIVNSRQAGVTVSCLIGRLWRYVQLLFETLE